LEIRFWDIFPFTLSLSKGIFAAWFDKLTLHRILFPIISIDHPDAIFSKEMAPVPDNGNF
jgi:hypothetical protein